MFRKKKEPENVDWLYNAKNDFDAFAADILPKLIALNLKHFGKETGFVLVNGRNGNPINFITEIEGLGMMDEFFFQALVRDCLLYFRNRPATEIVAICDGLKENLLKESYLK